MPPVPANFGAELRNLIEVLQRIEVEGGIGQPPSFRLGARPAREAMPPISPEVMRLLGEREAPATLDPIHRVQPPPLPTTTTTTTTPSRPRLVGGPGGTGVTGGAAGASFNEAIRHIMDTGEFPSQSMVANLGDDPAMWAILQSFYENEVGRRREDDPSGTIERQLRMQSEDIRNRTRDITNRMKLGERGLELDEARFALEEVIEDQQYKLAVKELDESIAQGRSLRFIAQQEADTAQLLAVASGRDFLTTERRLRDEFEDTSEFRDKQWSAQQQAEFNRHAEQLARDANTAEFRNAQLNHQQTMEDLNIRVAQGELSERNRANQAKESLNIALFQAGVSKDVAEGTYRDRVLELQGERDTATEAFREAEAGRSAAAAAATAQFRLGEQAFREAEAGRTGAFRLGEQQFREAEAARSAEFRMDQLAMQQADVSNRLALGEGGLQIQRDQQTLDRELALLDNDLAEQGLELQERNRLLQQRLGLGGLEIERARVLAGLTTADVQAATSLALGGLSSQTALQQAALQNPFGYAALQTLGGFGPTSTGAGGPTALPSDRNPFLPGLQGMNFQVPTGTFPGQTVAPSGFFSAGLPTLGQLQETAPGSLQYLQNILGFTGTQPETFGRLAAGVTPAPTSAFRMPEMVAGGGQRPRRR